jgi:hypothetical protein
MRKFFAQWCGRSARTHDRQADFSSSMISRSGRARLPSHTASRFGLSAMARRAFRHIGMSTQLFPT